MNRPPSRKAGAWAAVRTAISQSKRAQLQEPELGTSDASERGEGVVLVMELVAPVLTAVVAVEWGMLVLFLVGMDRKEFFTDSTVESCAA